MIVSLIDLDSIDLRANDAKCASFFALALVGLVGASVCLNAPQCQTELAGPTDKKNGCSVDNYANR